MAEREPKVCTEDVKAILWKAIKPRDPGKPSPADGMSVEVLADRAGISGRTIYRVLDEEEPYAPAMKLDLADRLLLAADSHLTEVRVVSDEGGCDGSNA